VAGLGALLLTPAVVWAQGRARTAGVAPAAKSQSAREQAPYDLSGYWTSVITQNWQYRMIVPGPGEYADIPINAKAKQLADAFRASADTAAGKQCEAYGAALIMRLPEHLHIHWQDADVLRVDTDAGMQTRLLHFRAAAADASPEASWQGWSAAKWVLAAAGGAGAGGAGAASAPQVHYGSLQVLTDHLLPGLLRKNGVPYSAETKLTEWWDLRVEPEGDQWLTITSTVVDPQYLQAPLIYDSIFQKEPDDSKWAPAPCSLTS
jgi:hypothetical protein